MTRSVVRFRADASSRVGVGHVMRSLTLAAAVRARGHAAVLHSADLHPVLAERARRLGVDVEAVRSAPRSVEDAIELAARPAAAVWIDGYEFDLAYMSALGGGGSLLAAIDDGCEGALHGVSLVLNPNPSATRARYADLHGVRLLLGLRFALIRDDVLQHRRRRLTPGHLRRVVVSMGGADPQGLTPRLVGALARRLGDDVAVGATVGVDNLRHAEVRSAIAAAGSQCREVQPDELASALAGADLAVLAAGTTLWEAAALGVPVVSVVTADNQQGLLDWRAGRCWTDVCDARLPGGVDEAVERAVALGADPVRRHEMSRRGKRLVDGRGAARAAEALDRVLARD